MSDHAKNKKAIARLYELLSEVADAEILVKTFAMNTNKPTT